MERALLMRSSTAYLDEQSLFEGREKEKGRSRERMRRRKGKREMKREVSLFEERANLVERV